MKNQLRRGQRFLDDVTGCACAQVGRMPSWLRNFNSLKAI